MGYWTDTPQGPRWVPEEETYDLQRATITRLGREYGDFEARPLPNGSVKFLPYDDSEPQFVVDVGGNAYRT